MTPPDGERTAEERERARREREARRAARARGEQPPRGEGGGAGLLGGLLGGRSGGERPPEPVEPPVQQPVESPPGEPVALPPEEPVALPPEEPVEPLPAEPVEPLASEPPLPLADEPAAVAPPEERSLQPEAAVPRRTTRDRAADRAAAARVALRARRRREQGTAAAPPGGRRFDQRLAATEEKQPRRPRSGIFRALLAAGAVILLVGAWFAWSLLQPFKGDGEGEVRVNVPTGATVTEIADLLEENDVVANAFFFRVRVTLGGSRGDLKPGSYRLRRDMSYGAAIAALSEGPPRDVVTLTIPEGRSRGEISPLVAEAGLSGDYERASRRSRELDPRRYGASGARDLEGFLFPATYELSRNASARDLVQQQLETFKREFRKVNLRPARQKNLTAYDVLIIASMVEREAAVARERPLIASVIYNRLSAGMPLGIDATIRFALDNWEEPLRESELAADTPYNTRTNAGLPPGPIGNPGIDSIEAAANPPDTDYLYFVVKPGECGEHAFSETDAEFQRDVGRYEAERERRGGRSPTDC